MEQGHYVQLKPNVWKWQVGPHAYSIKKYNYQSDADKVRFIHEELSKIGADFVVPIEPYPDPFVIQQPWVESGRKVKYDQAADRRETLSVLEKLHRTNEHIDWKGSAHFHEINIKRKWAHRLEKWKKHESFLNQTLGFPKTQLITSLASDSFAKLKPMSRDSLTLLHGDVVHHNFVHDHNSGKLYLIDFDLSCVGPAEVELMLWAHRVLPHFDYDIHRLLDEHPSLRKIDLNYLLFPNELMREWLYASTLSQVQQSLFLPKLKVFTNKALKHMPKLWEDISKMNR